MMGGLYWKVSVSQTGDYFSRVYQDLPAHTTIVYTISTWTLNTWDYPDTDLIQIQFDNLAPIDSYQLIYSINKMTHCSGPPELVMHKVQLFGYLAHSPSSLTLKFISQLNSDTSDETFGIRDIQLTFLNKDIGSDFFCASSVDNYPLYNFVICTCTPGQYSSTGSSSDCTNCDSACASCYGAGADRCFECAEGYYFDGTSCTVCDSSCSSCIGSAANECISCPPGYALFNGICIDEDRCTSSPFVLNDDPKECVSPCSGTTIDTWDDSN